MPRGLAAPLVESLSVEVVVREESEPISEVVPGPTIGYEDALRLALHRVRDRG